MLTATVVGAACCACVGGILGTELLNSGHLFHGVYPSPGPGLQWKELCGLLLQTWVLPFAFVLGGSAAVQLARHRALPAAAHAAGHVALAACCGVACWRSWNSTFGVGGNVLHCAVFGCGASADDGADAHWRGSGTMNFAYKVALGAVVFVVSVLCAAFNLALSVSALLELARAPRSGSCLGRGEGSELAINRDGSRGIQSR